MTGPRTCTTFCTGDCRGFEEENIEEEGSFLAVYTGDYNLKFESKIKVVISFF